MCIVNNKQYIKCLKSKSKILKYSEVLDKLIITEDEEKEGQGQKVKVKY